MKTKKAVRKNNKYWRDRAIREEAGVDRLSSETSKKMAESYRRSYRRLTKEINALYAEILDKGLENVSRTDLYNLQHYVSLRKAVEKEVKDLAIEQKKSLDTILDIIAVGTYRSNCEELGIGFDIVSELNAKAIVTENWSGITYSNRIWKNAEGFNTRVMEDVESLVTGGALPADVKKQLMEDYSVSWNEADRLVRTESSRAYNKAARDSYTAAGIAECEYLAESDCCEVCADFKGRKMPIMDFPELPMHPNCRCTMAPIVEGFK